MEPDNTHHDGRTLSDQDGLSPTTSADVRPRPTILQIRREDHTLTSREVLKIFERAGLMRSQRSIERYCLQNKLDCFIEPDEQRYYVTPASVERLIGMLKEIQARHHESGEVEHEDSAERDTGRQPPPAQPSAASPDELRLRDDKIAELEKKLFLLSVDKEARDQIVTMLRQQMNDDRGRFIEELTKQSRRVGVLETQLLQLEAPRHHTPPPPTPVDAAATYRDVEDDMWSSHTTPPSSDVPADAPLSNNPNNNYEHSPQ